MTCAALYVYAVIPDAGKRNWGPIGLDGTEVRAEVAGSLAALVHDVPGGRPYQGTDDQVRGWVLQHSRVVEQAWETAGTVLPVTFDVLVRADVEAPAPQRLRAWLAESQPALSAALDRFKDRVELKLELGFRSVSGNGSPHGSARAGARPAGGRQRLLEKQQALERDRTVKRRADDVYQIVRRRLAREAEDLIEHRRSRSEGLTSVFCGSVLVPRARIETIGFELARLQGEQPDLVVRFLGPWPPYSFAEAALSTVPTPPRPSRPKE